MFIKKSKIIKRAHEEHKLNLESYKPINMAFYKVCV